MDGPCDNEAARPAIGRVRDSYAFGFGSTWREGGLKRSGERWFQIGGEARGVTCFPPGGCSAFSSQFEEVGHTLR